MVRIIDIDMTGATSATIAEQQQWETGLMLKVSGIDISGDHFDAKFEHAGIEEPIYRVCRSYSGVIVVPVPNPMLTTSGTVTATFCGVTVSFNVVAADKPEGYEDIGCEDVDTHQAMIASLMIQGESGDTAITNDEIDKLF